MHYKFLWLPRKVVRRDGSWPASRWLCFVEQVDNVLYDLGTPQWIKDTGQRYYSTVRFS